MDNRQTRTLQSFQHILVYLDQHPVTPAPPLLAGMRKSLEASMARIEAAARVQHSVLTLDGGKVELRRKKLRLASMLPLARIARPLLAFAPGVESALRVPHARADAKTVADAALRMADALAPHAKLLAAAGCSREFLKEFRQEARQLALAAKTTEAARQRRATATAAIADELRKAMQTVTVIEGLVMLHDPKKLHYWRNRRRVSKRIGRPKKRNRAAPVQPEERPPQLTS